MSKTNKTSKLHELRTGYNYTQEFVASWLGIARQTYSHYETGKRRLNIDTITRLAQLYHISTDELIYLASPQEDTTLSTESTESSSESKEELSLFLEYLSNPRNEKKLRYLSRYEKELLYYFEKISHEDKLEAIEILKIKAKKKKKKR